MKKLLLFAAATGMMLVFSGCSAKQETIDLDGINGNGCNNPKCQCPKPCACGSDCRCGTGGKSKNLQGK